MTTARPFPYAISGVFAQIGEVMPIADWAELARIPHRHRPGQHITGQDITRILGIHGKSWDAGQQRFATLDTIVGAACNALASAALEPGEVEHIVVSTCSPHQIMLDQDSFALAREIGVPDSVAPSQLGAGCAGLGRAVALLARMNVRNALVICYNIGSSWGLGADGGPLSIYAENTHHPTPRRCGAAARCSPTPAPPWSSSATSRARGSRSTPATRTASASSRASWTRWCTTPAAARTTRPAAPARRRCPPSASTARRWPATTRAA
ncbi:hypothetical protein GXW82_42630 [Streptacidiphilus sp. 4-A2]|nr:hypothetical protein [Streptacidiphilus sp. 4-A2]